MSTLAIPTPVPTLRHADAARPLRALDGLSVDDLRDLMQSVTETTQRLQATHIALHEQVARLQRELAEANAALRRSQSLAALGEMAAGIAHEVRNPLASIQLYAQMLAEDLADRPPQAEVCGKISHAVTTLDAIVRDVLRFAREATICPEPTSSTDLLERALHACRGLMNGQRVAVSMEAEPRLSLHVDAGLMTQALSNVIRNAVEAVAGEPIAAQRIRIWAQRRRVRAADGSTSQHVALCVEDSGPGIPRDVRDRIFNPFFTTRPAGTGLGLAIVHRIVDAHGGHVLIGDARPCGARVELCLPVKTGAKRSSPSRRNSLASAEHEAVLG